jgi:hypothetical protein
LSSVDCEKLSFAVIASPVAFRLFAFFRHGLTNAKVERLNGKIQRFASNNCGLKDKDFFLYRTANYFS